MNSIGQRVRSEREARNWSRAKLAELAGISPTALSDLELGYTQRGQSLHKIAQAMGVNVSWLETGKGEKSTGDASQPARYDDATMAQAVELLHLMADARPDDKRFRRITWGMIKVAAKGIDAAKGDSRQAIFRILEELNSEA